MSPRALDIANQGRKANVKSGNHQFVALEQFAAARFIHHIFVVADICEHQQSVRLICKLNLLSRFEIGRVEAFYLPEIRNVGILSNILGQKVVVGVA